MKLVRRYAEDGKVAIRPFVETRPLEELDKLSGRARVVRGHDARVEALFDTDESADEELTTFLSELRLVKDEHEVGQLQEACDATALGFEDVVRALDRAKGTSERWIEGVFGLRARVEGNDVGYGSICAAGAHACTLHWTDNDGPVEDGQLVLLDMGVEGHELYTADITRTLPVSGTFTPRRSNPSSTDSPSSSPYHWPSCFTLVMCVPPFGLSG